MSHEFERDVILWLQYIGSRLQRIDRTLARVLAKEREIMATMQQVLDAANQQTTRVAGVKAVVDNLKTMLDAAAAAGDPAKLSEVLALIEANSAGIDAAILAGTPGGPPAGPAPVAAPPN